MHLKIQYFRHLFSALWIGSKKFLSYGAVTKVSSTLVYGLLLLITAGIKNCIHMKKANKSTIRPKSVMQARLLKLIFRYYSYKKKEPGSPGSFEKSPGDFWTSLVLEPRDHGTFKVSRSCPVSSCPVTFPGLPGTEQSCYYSTY